MPIFSMPSTRQHTLPPTIDIVTPSMPGMVNARETTVEPTTVDRLTLTGTSILTTITPTPSPTEPACVNDSGKVEVLELVTSLLPDPLIYRIYLPPCYDENLTRRYPVLYLIHGQSYDDTQWERLGVPEAADKLIADGEVAPFIVVMPRDRVWLEPTQDNFGLAVEQWLIPWIDEHYRTLPKRLYRAIGGLSRGGGWAVDIGLSHPELFSAVGVHSGFVFQSDVQYISTWLNDMPEGMMPRIYMDIGNADRTEIKRAASWLEDLLTQLDIPHEWHMYIGQHEESYWHSHIEEYLRWYTQEW